MNAFLNAVHADHLRLGYASGNCAACEPRGWWVDARAGRLRASVVGGVPIETEPDSLPDSQISAWLRAPRPRADLAAGDDVAQLVRAS